MTNGNGKKLNNIIMSALTAGVIGAFGWAWTLNSEMSIVKTELKQVQNELVDIWGKYNTSMIEKSIKERNLEHRITVLETKID